IKGHVITFAQNPVSLTKILPLPIYRLCDNLKVVFVGQGHPSETQLKKVLRIRKNKVAEALKWLIEYNILYKGVEIEEMRLNSLPEDGILMALMATTVVVDVDPKDIEHYTGYYEFTNGNSELRSSGMAYTDNISFTEKSRTLEILEKMIDELNTNKDNCTKTISMPHSNNPKNEYTDSTLLPAAFPVLFPYGIGGHEDKFRNQHIHSNDT
ncbi:hypothetical protein C2G38_1968003, partial [Gigaspora rosea]